jgi:hypothetical protein
MKSAIALVKIVIKICSFEGFSTYDERELYEWGRWQALND